MADTDVDVVPVRLPSGTKAVVHLPRSFTLADGVHLMNFLTEYVEECVEGKECATPPSPSTAPEVGERAAFEAWLGRPMMNPAHPSHYNGRDVRTAWEAWQHRALASRPAEVDDEGLPQLPESAKLMIYELQRQPYFTAEQYRQGQRDAVAADRARRGGRQ